MPKFQMNNEADLFYSGESTANSSGKEIGELVVLKSGRMLMKINGVYYDTSVCGSPGDDHGSPLTTVVAEQPSVNNTSHTAAVEPNYDLLEFDTLKYKLICTPKLNES
ncbi:hypothetical protein AGDE_02046 [Angomonas deanei]|nr:hypothetical protein AGDE_03588 [Angomonas deanei]EPY41877.1 hypothetical protein AGDE_02046 [Angomonas deanei]|eukprot:EPY40340.1 hypothetical protein AGDE_03588 [Angomonas deanei]